MNPFDFLTSLILILLIAVYKLLHMVGIPGALGFAIIILTALIRLALWPVTSSQLKSTQKMAALKPHLDRIKAEHGHDKVRHEQEITKLYKEHGVNPLAGCLPLLLQIPIFFALYSTLNRIVQFNKPDYLQSINAKLHFAFLHLDKVPSTSFLGINLYTKPSDWHQIGALILLIPILTGLIQLVQSKMITPQSSPKPKEGQKEDLEDSMAQVSSQMTLIMPVMFAYISYRFPLGLALYWNTFTIIGIVQQYIVSGPGGIAKYLPKKWRKQI